MEIFGKAAEIRGGREFSFSQIWRPTFLGGLPRTSRKHGDAEPFRSHVDAAENKEEGKLCWCGRRRRPSNWSLLWGILGPPRKALRPQCSLPDFRAYLILELFNKTNAFKSSPRFALPNSSKFFSRLVIVSSRGRVLLKLPSTLPALPFHIQGVLAVLWLRQPRRGRGGLALEAARSSLPGLAGRASASSRVAGLTEPCRALKIVIEPHSRLVSKWLGGWGRLLPTFFRDSSQK